MNNAVTFSPIIVGAMRLGLWGANFNTTQLQQFIEGCLSMQLTSFDHADIYGDYTTESDFGKVFQQQPTLRQQLQIITKCGIRRVCANRPQHRTKTYDSSPEHIITSVENSLKALHTDYIDVLLLHRPDFLMNPSEIAKAFEDLKASGKVLAFGVSNFSPSQFDLLNSYTPLISNQIEVSITQRNAFTDGTLDQCLKHQIRPMAWSPLAGGALFGNNQTPSVQRIKKAALSIQQKYNASLDQILLAWLLKHPSGILPVTGTTQLSRIKAAKEALPISLTNSEWYDLWQAATGETVA